MLCFGIGSKQSWRGILTHGQGIRQNLSGKTWASGSRRQTQIKFEQNQSQKHRIRGVFRLVDEIGWFFWQVSCSCQPFTTPSALTLTRSSPCQSHQKIFESWSCLDYRQRTCTVERPWILIFYEYRRRTCTVVKPCAVTLIGYCHRSWGSFCGKTLLSQMTDRLASAINWHHAWSFSFKMAYCHKRQTGSPQQLKTVILVALALKWLVCSSRRLQIWPHCEPKARPKKRDGHQRSEQQHVLWIFHPASASHTSQARAGRTDVGWVIIWKPQWAIIFDIRVRINIKYLRIGERIYIQVFSIRVRIQYLSIWVSVNFEHLRIRVSTNIQYFSIWVSMKNEHLRISVSTSIQHFSISVSIELILSSLWVNIDTKSLHFWVSIDISTSEYLGGYRYV